MQDEKHQIVNKIKYSYSTDWIYNLESKDHWLLYHEQQRLMKNLVSKGDQVLEIGPGTGFCSNYLKAKGVKVTTLDIDEGKKPDLNKNIVKFQPEQRYDHILAFEVFEHIPYNECIKVLKRLKGFCNNIFLSLPVNELRLIDGIIFLPIIKKISFSVFLPRNKITENHHFWEVNDKHHKKKKIIRDFQALGYSAAEVRKYKSRIFIRLQNTGKSQA